MKVVITGAAGFLGECLADYLLGADSPLAVTELVLADSRPARVRGDPRVRCLVLDLTAADAAEHLVGPDCAVFFHLAAVVSGRAEADFDLGLRVNFDASRALLEAARRHAPSLKFVFASTLGVFGGRLPAVVGDGIAVTPQNSYGTAKAMVELLVNDYSRRGYVDGRIVRLPTVSVRAGAANEAVTSFASGIIREPLNGETAECPVAPELRTWLTSPATCVRNIAHAATLPAEALGAWRCVHLPGLAVSVREMLVALRAVGGAEAVARVRFVRNPFIERIVASFPTEFDNSRALCLGFAVDTDFTDIVRAYVSDSKENSNK